jgi:hypothetical protein
VQALVLDVRSREPLVVGLANRMQDRRWPSAGKTAPFSVTPVRCVVGDRGSVMTSPSSVRAVGGLDRAQIPSVGLSAPLPRAPLARFTPVG